MFGDENHDLSQSQTSRRREKLSELQKGLIREIVSDYCPRVTGANLEDYGMFTTPEAKIKPGSNRASYHQEIPFIKMTIEILKLSERDRTFDGKDGQAYAREHIHNMNKEIQRKVDRGLTWQSSQVLRSLHRSAIEWEETWANPATKRAWYIDVTEWNKPQDILYRRARTACNNFIKQSNVPAQPRNAYLPDCQDTVSLSNCLEKARGLTEDHAEIREWSSVHFDLLWTLMIEHGPKVAVNKAFACLSTHAEAGALWPTITLPGKNTVTAVRETLRQKWSVLGGWVLGCPVKQKFCYSAESQLQVLRLLRDGKIPLPHHSTRIVDRMKKTNPQITLDSILEDKIKEKQAEVSGENTNATGPNSPLQSRPQTIASTDQQSSELSLRLHGQSQYSQELLVGHRQATTPN
ncbi:hypothetical protein M9434_004898 [Picochlorum sp. BPE23]|nr:hypothetical protein M9434_004898 [Picochlorum sp. BPE23]